MMRKLATYALIALVSLVGLELMAVAAVWFLSKGPSVASQALARQLDFFHPLFRSRADVDSGAVLAIHQRASRNNPFVFHPRTGYDLRPSSEIIQPDDSKLLVDDAGFVCNTACETLPYAKPAAEIRIFVMGGSTVQGTSTGDLTISGQLEVALQKSGLFAPFRVRVINGGVSGFFSPQEVNRFLFKVAAYDPDMVIFFDGHNDFRRWQQGVFYNPQMAEYDAIIGPNYHDYDYKLITDIERIRNPLGALLHTGNLFIEHYPALYYTTVLARYVRRVGMEARRESDSAQRSAAAETGRLAADRLLPTIYRRDGNSLYYYMANLDMAAGAARARGIAGLFCLQPVIFFEQKEVLAGPEPEIQQTISDFNYIREYFAVARRAFRDRASNNDGQIAFCDLTGIFAKDPQHAFTDQVHYTPYANGVIAGRLLEELSGLAPAVVKNRSISSAKPDQTAPGMAREGLKP